jgi:hypothetical protein
VALLVLAADRWRRPSRPHASSHRFAHLPSGALLLGALAVLVVAANLMLVLPVLLGTLLGDRVRPALDRLEGWPERQHARGLRQPHGRAGRA